jgi:hypothetical protein
VNARRASGGARRSRPARAAHFAVARARAEPPDLQRQRVLQLAHHAQAGARGDRARILAPQPLQMADLLGVPALGRPPR